MKALKMSGKMKVIPMRNEIEAMNIIINIQTMQNYIHGECFDYSDFSSNTIDDLRNLQDEMIKEYNKYIASRS